MNTTVAVYDTKPYDRESLASVEGAEMIDWRFLAFRFGAIARVTVENVPAASPLVSHSWRARRFEQAATAFRLPTTRKIANERYPSPDFRGPVYCRLPHAPARRGSSTDRAAQGRAGLREDPQGLRRISARDDPIGHRLVAVGRHVVVPGDSSARHGCGYHLRFARLAPGEEVDRDCMVRSGY